MMFVKKPALTIISIFLLLGISFSNSFALSWFQKTSINNDRSGTITISYSISNSDLKGAEIYKSLPFTEDKIKSIYSSDNNKVSNFKINKKNDSTTVNIVLSIKNIVNLKSAPGFSNINVTWYKNGDSTVFMYKADGNSEFADNVLASCTYELPTNEILRSSGIKKGDNSFSLQIKPENFKNGYTIFAVFKNIAGDTKSETTTGNDKEGESGGCGLFGIEMPLIFGFGMLLLRRRIKK